MIINKTSHPEVLIITPAIFEDDRGFFMESYNKEKYFQFGITHEFVQDNHSCSTQNTLRGLHYQVNKPQGKLVRAVFGEIYDVAVDIRKDSSNFGKWVAVILSAENKKQLWIPPGFAHGFLTLSEKAEVLYKTTDYYFAAGERCIQWDDPNLAIEWPLPKSVKPLLSKKDANGNKFTSLEVD